MRLPCRWQGHAPRFALAMTFLIGWEYLAASSWAVTHRADSATRMGRGLMFSQKASLRSFLIRSRRSAFCFRAGNSGWLDFHISRMTC